jgi:GDP-L-fucose synthase
MEHVLVTGGAGFIGSALIDELNAHGFDTSCVDHHDNRAVSQRAYMVDLLTPGEFERALNLSKPDRVVHLAAQVGRKFGEDDMRHTVRENAEMSTVVARVCGERGIPLVYCSTSEVYGDQGPHAKLNEDSRMVLPHNLYGLTKRWGEEVAQLYAPMDLVIWRPSMPYGPGAPPGRGRRALDNMLWQAHHRMPITVHKGAERSWCWLGDVVRGMRLTIEASQKNRASSAILDHQPIAYNIGRDDDPVSMLDVAKFSCEIAGASEDLIRLVDPPQRQTVVKRLSTDRLRSLGWRPQVELEDGMREVYEWVKRFSSEGRMVA